MLDWQAYYELEPWGTPADDDRWRLHYIMQFRSGFTGKEPTWLDRDPEETARIAAEAEAAMTLEAKLEAFFSVRAVEAAELAGDDDTTFDAIDAPDEAPSRPQGA